MATINLDTFGVVLARLAYRRGAQLDTILAELGVSLDDFIQAEERLCLELSEAWPKRTGVAAMKFATALGTELQTLRPLGSNSVAREEAPKVGPQIPTFLKPKGEVPLAPLATVRSPEQVSMQGTVATDLSDIIAAVSAPVLPFVTPEERVRVEPPRTSAHGTGRTEVSERSERPASAPPQGVPVHDVHALPLETYASISGALAKGESREAVLARHGLTAAAFGTLATAWAQRFQSEPQLLGKFKELVRLSSSPGGRTPSP